MTKLDNENGAFGSPGIHPRWTHGGKDGVGTAYAASSQVWFTLWNGIVTEVYYPTVDMPQMRDVQLLFTDGQSFFHQETQYLETCIQRMPSCLGYRVQGKDPEGRYAYVKELIADQTMRGPLWIELAKKAPDTFWLTHEKLRATLAKVATERERSHTKDTVAR